MKLAAKKSVSKIDRLREQKQISQDFPTTVMPKVIKFE